MPSPSSSGWEGVGEGERDMDDWSSSINGGAEQLASRATKLANDSSSLGYGEVEPLWSVVTSLRLCPLPGASLHPVSSASVSTEEE